MKTLCTRDDLPIFLIKEVKLTEYSLGFEVYEVNSWDQDDNPIIDGVSGTGIELYLKGTIKWDGCSHLDFGNEGYIHLCGKHFFDNHCQLIKELFEYASKVIKNFDHEVAE